MAKPTKPSKAGNSPKPSEAKDAKETKETNGWDVCIRFLDVVNDLFKTGNIFGAVLLLAFGYAIYVTYKLPPENINAYILMIMKFLRAEKFYIFPGVGLLIASLSANYMQHKYYTKEIKRLVSVRSQLIHGFNNGELEVLPEHSSSEFNIESVN